MVRIFDEIQGEYVGQLHTKCRIHLVKKERVDVLPRERKKKPDRNLVQKKKNQWQQRLTRATNLFFIAKRMKVSCV
jgi:hypothetical protein